MFPIISKEDITFPMGLINYSIIGFSLSGFIVIYGWFLIIGNNEDRVINESKSSCYKFYTSIIQYFSNKILTKKSKINIKNYLNLLILMTCCILIYFVLIKKVIPNLGRYFSFMFIINFFIFPSLFIIYKHKRNIIFSGYIFYIIFFGILYINTAFKIAEKEPNAKNQNISFSFQGRTICSSKNNRLVYPGYKYIVMTNDSIHKNYLYPTKDITEINIEYTPSKRK